MHFRIPRILIDSITKGKWRQATPDALRHCLGSDLDDLTLFDSIDAMTKMSAILDHAGYVDQPGFCLIRNDNRASDDPRLEFPRALFIGGSIAPGDDVFLAIRRENYEEYDPLVLVLDWRKEAPFRWDERRRLSELIGELFGW